MRLKAYVTEYFVAGRAEQMFSLDTCARAYAAGDGDWSFVTVKRPSGAEVTFSLKGAQAGQAIDSRNPYRMVYANGAYELHFGGDKQVVHRFGGYGDLGVPAPASMKSGWPWRGPKSPLHEPWRPAAHT